MGQISLFPAMGISSTGLDAERTRMEVASNNLANAHTTRGADGGAFQRQMVLFTPVNNENAEDQQLQFGGVQVDGVVSQVKPPNRVYAPYHPDAGPDGMVEMPSVSPVEEMLDMITATRAYEANLSALKQSRDMAQATITLGKPK